jgi:hypothetical protein
MPNNPTRISKQHHSTQSQTRSKTTPESTRHHGILLLPYESLTHCTSYLEPPTLLYLSLVNRHFYEHVANDLTWLYAFNLHFLGIGPEVTPLGSGALLLRRTESTWRKEYINRYNLTRLAFSFFGHIASRLCKSQSVGEIAYYHYHTHPASFECIFHDTTSRWLVASYLFFSVRHRIKELPFYR